MDLPPCVCGLSGNHFCTPRADRAQAFFEKILVHTKGRFAGKQFILTPWQRDEIIRPLFGTVQFDEQIEEYVRGYSLAWIELARKNGKSELLSGIALMMLCADDEESAEVYSVAVDRDQASLVFNVAKRMVELSPVLRERLTIIDSRKRIIYPKTNSFYAVLPGDASGALGTNPSAVLFDEVLTQKDRHLWDAMRQGFGARRQPLMVAATTAAYTSAMFALEEHNYSQSLVDARAKGTTPDPDPARFVFMRNTPKDWDWREIGNPSFVDEGGVLRPATGWYWSNPALGDFLSLATLKAEAQEADTKPTAQNAFRVFRLNQWVGSAQRWIDLQLWDENFTYSLETADLKGEPCFGGLDLAAVSDFVAWCLVFKMPDDKYYAIWRYWIPRPAVNKRIDMREQLEVWAEEGYITITEGDTIRWDQVYHDIEQDLETYRVTMVGYDPWQAPQIVQWLEDGGIECIKVPQTTTRLNAPCKEIERALGARKFNHGNNPVTRWMVDNVEVFTDPTGNIRPDKAKSGEKIDGVSALANSVFVSLIPVEAEGDSAFFDLSEFL